jgi:hypothetical protein
MNTPREPDEPPEILFCPYCGEGFEGADECPEHELTLVPIDRLRRPQQALEEVAFFVDPRRGRGPVLIGSFLVLGGFLAPFARSRGFHASALEIALDGAHNLWLTPIAASLLLWILWSRRSRTQLRAARFAVFGLALGGVLPLLYTSWRIELVAGVQDASVAWGWGRLAVIAGLVLAALGSFWLGGRRDAG